MSFLFPFQAYRTHKFNVIHNEEQVTKKYVKYKWYLYWILRNTEQNILLWAIKYAYFSFLASSH